MLFDGDMNSLVRGLEANPFTLEIEFLEPVSVEGLELSLGAPEMQITATVTMNSGEEVRYIREVPEAALIRRSACALTPPILRKNQPEPGTAGRSGACACAYLGAKNKPLTV